MSITTLPVHLARVVVATVWVGIFLGAATAVIALSPVVLACIIADRARGRK